MGNKSWFTAVKRVFTSHKSSTKTQDHDGNKMVHKTDKRRWLFRTTTHVKQQVTQVIVQTSCNDVPKPVANDQNHADMKAMAAEKIIRVATKPPSITLNHHFAAILIQAFFRGYLARRASRALKGIVMLQAVIRGQNVRKQAIITLRCMQALVRVQSRLHDQRSKPSHEGRRKSMTSEKASFCESKYLQDFRRRKSMVTSRNGTCILDDRSDKPHNLEELDAKLQNREISNRNMSAMDVKELQETASWLDQWIRAKQWENHITTSRASFDRRDSIKTIEIDSSRPISLSGHKLLIPNSPSRRSSYSPSSSQQPITPSPVKTVPLQIRSASPRVMGSMCRYSTCANDMTVPNYMAATESVKARLRSQSTPRHRPSAPERERVGSVKKKLAYPVPYPCDNGNDSSYNVHYCDYGHNLKSPSFKSVQVGHVGMGQQWCYADSTPGGVISPSSTADLRRWLW